MALVITSSVAPESMLAIKAHMVYYGKDEGLPSGDLWFDGACGRRQGESTGHCQVVLVDCYPKGEYFYTLIKTGQRRVQTIRL
jgi:hypothetical protein